MEKMKLRVNGGLELMETWGLRKWTQHVITCVMINGPVRTSQIVTGLDTEWTVTAREGHGHVQVAMSLSLHAGYVTDILIVLTVRTSVTVR